MSTAPSLEKGTPSSTEAVYAILNVLSNNLTIDLRPSLATLVATPTDTTVRLVFNAEICRQHPSTQSLEESHSPHVHLGSINISPIDIQRYLREYSTATVAAACKSSNANVESHDISNSTVQPQRRNSMLVEPEIILRFSQESDHHLDKRRKISDDSQEEVIVEDNQQDDYHAAVFEDNATTRQIQTKSREFPQRKKKKDQDVHELQPLSTERFVSGVWKQIFNSVELTPSSLDNLCGTTNPGSSSNIEAFRFINTICLRVTKLSKCSRALETIVQARWVDCFEARVKEIEIETPFLSITETKMCALREACTMLQWSEKELRNKLSIWRGYKEIKDAGGWACLVFAGSGIYRFCKYRVGFGNGLTTKLGKQRSSLEVAADTIHPEWRQLLSIIGEETHLIYTGHPHDWVVSDGGTPLELKSTYTQWDPDFHFTHLESSQLDPNSWGTDDPRWTSNTDTSFCNSCGYLQSNDVSRNECRCFPELYGGCKTPVAVQVFRTPSGKNNGLIARCEFPRGAAIGEFVGLITKDMEGKDVMQSDNNGKRYQIFQGKLGNYTRFVNHSCAPNSQFQKFCWLGSERVILTSRGIESGSEITVDYSDEYWKGLDKECKCGEPCCRYLKKQTRKA